MATSATVVGTDSTGTSYHAQDVSYHSPISYPPHERMVEASNTRVRACVVAHRFRSVCVLTLCVEVSHMHLTLPIALGCAQIEVDLGIGSEEITVLGSDLTHEYVSVNADYRS